MVEAFSENGVIIPENIMKKNSDIESVAIACLNMSEDKIIWHTESTFHSIYVCENNFGRFIKYGISFQAGKINSNIYCGNIPYLNYFLIPYLLNHNVKKILFIGLGTGILVKQLEKLYDKLQIIDVVDIEENILFIASEFFDFVQSDKINFYLQDALVYLRTNKTKYDLIIVDAAGNEGIDERFFKDEFFECIKKSLSKNGIFAFNSCASCDFDENANDFFGFTVSKYKQYFKNFAVFDCKTSDKLYYKIFYDIDKRVLDVTNAIIIASDNNFNQNIFNNPNKKQLQKISSINVNIIPYLKDLHKIYEG